MSASFRRIAGQTSWLIGGTLLRNLIRIAYVLIVARFLGPDLYGIFAFAQSYYALFIPFTTLGLDAIITREIARSRELGPVWAGHLFRLRLILVSIAIPAALGWLFLTEPSSYLRLVTAICVLTLAFRPLVVLEESIFVAIGRANLVFRLNTTIQMLEAMAGSILLLAGFSLEVLALVHVSAWWMQATIGWNFARSHVLMVRNESHWLLLRKSFKRILLPLALLTIAASWFTNGPLILMRLIADDPDQLGHFSAAMAVLSIGAQFGHLWGKAALPVLVRNDVSDVLILRQIELVVVGGSIVALVMQVWSRSFFVLLFGTAFESSGDMAATLLWALIPWVWSYLIMSDLVARGSYWPQAVATISGVSIMFALVASLAPTGGVNALISGLIAGLSVQAIVLTGALAKFVPILTTGRILFLTMLPVIGFWVLAISPVTWPSATRFALSLSVVPAMLVLYFKVYILRETSQPG